MAQLRYSKAIACGTAVTVGLVGAYLYKNITSRNALKKKLGDLTESECRETCTARCQCGEQSGKAVENAEDIAASSGVSPLNGSDSDENSAKGSSGHEKGRVKAGGKKRDKGASVDPVLKKESGNKKAVQKDTGNVVTGRKQTVQKDTANVESGRKQTVQKDSENVETGKKQSPESKKTNKKSGKKEKGEVDKKKDSVVENRKTKKERDTEKARVDKTARDDNNVKLERNDKGTERRKVDWSDDRSDFLKQTMEDFEELMFASEDQPLEASSSPVPVEEETIFQSVEEVATESSVPSTEPTSTRTISQQGEDDVFEESIVAVSTVGLESAVDPVLPPVPETEQELKKEVGVEENVTAPDPITENVTTPETVDGSGDNNAPVQHDSPSGGSDGGSEANSEGSASDSGRGSSDTSSVGKDQAPSPELPPMPVLYQFEFPTELCGRLIGKQGRNIKDLRDKTGAKVFLKPLAVTTKYQLCIMDGLPKSIEKALEVIKRRFPEVDTSRQSLTADAQGMNVKMPSMSQLHLPDEGISNIILTSVVSAGHVFLQQPGQSSFNALNRLNNCMNNCYCQTDRVPPLPQPIEVGIVCAAPVMDSWYRAQLVNYYQEENEADLRFLDYGGYARIDAGCLRQIRSDFLSLPFQAVECYLANIVPLQGESDFSEDARMFIEQIAQNFTLLQSKTVAFSMDGVPLIEIFYEEPENGNVHSVNRELVERGLAAWYEGVEEAVMEYPEEAYLVPVS